LRYLMALSSSMKPLILGGKIVGAVHPKTSPGDKGLA